jgi:hypothetical protein
MVTGKRTYRESDSPASSERSQLSSRHKSLRRLLQFARVDFLSCVIRCLAITPADSVNRTSSTLESSHLQSTHDPNARSRSRRRTSPRVIPRLMPPKVQAPPRKEACIIIVDVGASMGAQADDGRPTGLDNAKKAIQLSQTHPAHHARQSRVARNTNIDWTHQHARTTPIIGLTVTVRGRDRP